jgi:hypothetical protein
MHRVLSEVIASGNALLRVKGVHPHGEFGKWLLSEFGWKERTAQNFMRAAESFGENPQRVAGLPLRILYTLASQPQSTRDSILQRIGESRSEGAVLAEITTVRRERQQAQEAERRARRKAKATPEQLEKEHLSRRRKERKEARWAKLRAQEMEARQTAASEAANLIREHMPDKLGVLIDLIDKSGPRTFLDALMALNGAEGDGR